MISPFQSRQAGFEGLMPGTTLADLIQFQCLSMSTRAVRVEANAVYGRIYFTGGQVVHATVGTLAGEPALFEMLGWKNGTFVVEEGSRPSEETISRQWHSLLLEAAHIADETPPPSYLAVLPDAPAPMTRHPIEELRVDAEITAFAYSDHEGTLVESKGTQAEILHGGFAYALELLQLVGSSLGLENLREVHLQGKDGKALCMLLDEGILAATATGKVTLSTLARKFS